jgi:hypothetical protein
VHAAYWQSKGCSILIDIIINQQHEQQQQHQRQKKGQPW